MKKILFYLPVNHVGGIETSLEYLLRNFDFSRFSVEVVTELASDKECNEYIEAFVVKELFPFFLSKIFYKLKNKGGLPFYLIAPFYFFLREVLSFIYIKRKGYDCVVSYYQYNPVLIRFISKVFVQWIHGPLPRNKIISFFYLFFLKRSDFIIASSKELSEEVINITNCGCKAFISKSNNFSKKDYRDRNGGEKVKFLSLGRINENQKDYHTIFEAFSFLNERIVSLNESPIDKYLLSVVGDGPSRKEFLNKLNLSGIPFQYYGARKDIGEFYKGNDYFIFSSKFEGFGMVILEALSFGLRSLVSHCRYGPYEIMEAVDEKEFLYDVGDSFLLSNMLFDCIYGSDYDSLKLHRKALLYIESIDQNNSRVIEEVFGVPLCDM